MIVPVSEVLTLIQFTLCMIGNASELVSQTRRSRILETVDHDSWSKFGEGEFPSAKDTLFGEDFQTSLTTKVKKDTALSKAVSITRKSKKQGETPSCSSKEVTIFSRGLYHQVRRQAGLKFLPVQYTLYPEERNRIQQKKTIPQLPEARLDTPLYHKPKLPQEQFRKMQPRKP